MVSKRAKRVIVVLIIIFTIVLLTGISIYFYKTLNDTAKNEAFNVADVSTANDLEQMVSDADAIVVGEYEGLHSTVNLMRDEQDTSKESTTSYLGGKVYRFEVDKVLKGDIGVDDDELLLVHRYSGKFDIGETLGYKNEEVEEADPTYVKPTIGRTYIAFILEPEVEDYYGQSSEPYLIAVDDEGHVDIKSNIEDVLPFDDTVTGKSLSEIEAEIKQQLQ